MVLVNSKYIAVFMVLLVIYFVAATKSYAQMEFIKDGYEEKYFNNNEGPGAEIKIYSGNNHADYLYELPTVKALSNLFWSLGLYKLDNEWAVDEYILINECDLYKKYNRDDFEWEKIREATKGFIKNNLHEFPTRFNFMLPLKLKRYDEKRKIFIIADKYKIDAMRRFELLAYDFHREPCISSVKARNSYPRILYLEFSRPFNLLGVPMSKKMAMDYIERKNQENIELYKKMAARKKNIKYSVRDAYLVINVKIFAAGDIGFDRVYYMPTLQLMGILESYEIYGDKRRTDLLFSHSYISVNKNYELDVVMEDQYKTLREMSKGAGVLHPHN